MGTKCGILLEETKKIAPIKKIGALLRYLYRSMTYEYYKITKGFSDYMNTLALTGQQKDVLFNLIEAANPFIQYQYLGGQKMGIPGTYLSIPDPKDYSTNNAFNLKRNKVYSIYKKFCDLRLIFKHPILKNSYHLNPYLFWKNHNDLRSKALADLKEIQDNHALADLDVLDHYDSYEFNGLGTLTMSEEEKKEYSTAHSMCLKHIRDNSIKPTKKLFKKIVHSIYIFISTGAEMDEVDQTIVSYFSRCKKTVEAPSEAS